MTVDIDAAKLLAEAAQSEKTFDARAAVNETTYPTDKVEVFTDAATAHDLNVKAHEAAKARVGVESIKNGYFRHLTEQANESRTVEDEVVEIDAKTVDYSQAPGYAEAEEEASALEAEVAELVQKLQHSGYTYYMRGLAPKQWEVIHALSRKQIKEPARKNYAQDEDGEEEFNRVTHERNLDRMHWIDETTIAAAIIKVERNHDGATDTGVWKQEHVANLRENYMESEFDKLKSLAQTLTYANNIFQIAVQQDADFLSKR
jgi:hypothetical protein